MCLLSSSEPSILQALSLSPPAVEEEKSDEDEESAKWEEELFKHHFVFAVASLSYMDCGLQGSLLS